MRAENIFEELRSAVSKPDKGAARHNSWILEETWRIIDKRVSARQEHGQCQARVQRLGQAIRVALKGDRRRWVELEGEDVERILTGDPHHQTSKHGEG